jgi:hypothetical protein
LEDTAEDDQPDLKRFKVDVARDEFGAVELPKEMLKIIFNHLEARELSLVIVSARFLQDLLSENEWLLVYAGRWRRNRVLSVRANIIINIEDSNPKKLLETDSKRFVLFDYWHEDSWKIRYKLRSQLVDQVNPSAGSTTQRGVFALPLEETEWISVYKISGTTNEPTKYNNLEEIKENNSDRYPDAITDPRQVDNFDEIHAAVEFIVIGPSTIPVKFRVEMHRPIKMQAIKAAPRATAPKPKPHPRVRRGMRVEPIENEYRPARMRYFNTRLMAFDNEAGAWNIISVLYDNYDLEESDHENYSEFPRVAELLIGRELLQGAFQLYPWTSSVWYILVETAEICL